MASEQARLTAEVRGRVQGVGFRWFVQRAARDLQLAGYVRNEADGRTVEVVAEGSRAALENLLERLRQGPPGSYVESVLEAWGPAVGGFGGFDVRH